MSNQDRHALITAAVSIIDPRDGATFPGTKAEAVAAVLAWAADVRADFGDDDKTRRALTGWIANAQADRVAEIMAAIMLDHLDARAEVARNAPTKCAHCDKEIVWRDRLSVGKDAEGWYWELGDEYCSATGQTYHEPA
jgi:hypothetical protein